MTDTRHAHFGSLSRSALGLALLATTVVVGCVGGDAGAQADNAIDRETFIEAYIDLRVAALATDSAVLTDEARAEVLTRHQITADDLTHFGEVHGRNIEFMRDVWNEVERRMDDMTPEGAR